MSSTKLNVLTLNCWGLKLPKPFCQLREERFQAIGEYLSKGEYDLVLLQEVWVQSDYDQLCRQVFEVLPHSHYFHSGIFGSGLCVFSKHSILETLQHRYSLNGSPFKVFHGDWYVQKSAGLVQILVNGLRVNVYVTHTHANYSSKREEYRVHRIVQAFELGQFIRLTSDGCDVVLVGGDFNFQPSELGYNLVMANANLVDSWMTQRAQKTDDLGATANHPDNSFSGGRDDGPGYRLDYLLYRSNSGCDVFCNSCTTEMKRIPGRDYDYSDHYGVAANYLFKKNVTAMAPELRASALRELYTAAVPQLEDGIGQCHNTRIYYALFSVVSLLALTFLSNLQVGFCLDYLLGLLRIVLTLFLGLCLWCGIVVSNREENAIISVKKDMENHLRSLP